MTCETGSTCDLGCAAGGCTLDCNPGANCALNNCFGGNCSCNGC